MRRGWLIRGLFVLTLIQALPGHTAERLALVTGNDYPPFADSRLPGGGVATLVVQHVMAIIGGEASVEFLPWRRGYEETMRGRFDATFPYIRTAERERDFVYSAPLITLRQVVFMSAARAFPYRGIKDLHGRRACVALGYAPQPQLQMLIDQGLVERVSPTGGANCPGMIAADRADFFIQDERIGRSLVAKADLIAEVISVDDTPFGVSELYFIVPRRRPDAADLIERFNAGLRQLQSSDAYERLMLVE